MRKSGLIILILLTTFSFNYAQKRVSGSVKGIVKDTLGQQTLPDATISVMDLKDSSSTAFTVSGEKGVFEIKGLDAGDYRLMVSFQGYTPIIKKFSISASKPFFDAGIIIMEKSSVMLDEVVVERPPISIKKDTIEYNAGSFKTKPNASVEDLLKKLPGVQVDKDGTVKAQGEQIQKVYVDGKEFFGSDPKLATKNLTADMVESVQVYDDMSEQSKFTKIDDGSRQKTINLKLKKDKKNGYFGKANMGVGTDGRYDGNLSFNRFKGSRQISIIGAANNTNKQGFSFSDIISNMGGFGAAGGGGGFGGGGGQGGGGFGGIGAGQIANAARGVGSALGFGGSNNGITSSLSTGINYRDNWGSKIDISGSYFFSQTKNDLEQNIYRQTFFPDDSTTFTTQDRISQNINQNHRFNMRFEYKIDSMNSILYTPSVTFQHSEGESNDSSYTRSVKGSLDYLSQSGKTFNSNNRDGVSIGNNLLYRRRLNKTGRTFTLGWSNTYNNSNGEGKTLSPQKLYRPDSTTIPNLLSQDNESNQETYAHNNVISTSYTEPVSRNKLIEVNYAYTNNQNSSDKKTNNYDPSSGKYDSANRLQTNLFKNGFVASRVGANFRVQGKKYNYQLGGSIQFATLESIITTFGSTKDSVVKRSYTNFNPNASYNYNPKMGTNFRVNYRGRTNQPSTSQLQNVLDVSNPQNIKNGNPDLKQEFVHNLNVGYNSFKLANFQFMAVNFNAGLTQNKIANSIDTLGRGSQITKPVNLNGAFNSTAFFTYGKTMKKLKGGNINATTFVVYNRDVSLLYKEKNFNNSLMITQSLGFNYNHKQIDVGFNGSVSYNKIQYSLQSNLNNEYFTQNYSTDFSYTFLKYVIVSTEFDYTINAGLSDGFDQNVPYWNASIAYQLLKKRDGELKLAVFDILNQNKSLARTTGDNYIQDVRSNVLKRYFMLSFTYNIRHGDKQQNNFQIPKQFQRNMKNLRFIN